MRSAVRFARYAISPARPSAIHAAKYSSCDDGASGAAPAATNPSARASDAIRSAVRHSLKQVTAPTDRPTVGEYRNPPGEGSTGNTHSRRIATDVTHRQHEPRRF